MFRHFIYIGVIAAALLTAACAKTEVSYESPSEIALAPVVEGMTKAAVAAGASPTGQDLVVWANYAEVDGNTTAHVGDPYFSDAVFAANGNEWVGKDGGHYWPKQGSLTFSGCSMPTEGNGTVSYNYSNNKITVTNFKQPASTSQSLDLMWFNQTEAANKSAAGTALQVEMKHALAWVTIKARGKDASKDWQITELILDNVVLSGDVTCSVDGASWTIAETAEATKDNTDNDIVIFAGTHTLESISTAVETVSQGTVLVPQRPKILKVGYKTNPSSSVVSYKDLDLSDGVDNWAAGMHYTYEILFNPYKIQFNVTVEGLGDEGEIKVPNDDELWGVTNSNNN